MNTPAALAKKLDILREVALQEAPHSICTSGQ